MPKMRAKTDTDVKTSAFILFSRSMKKSTILLDVLRWLGHSLQPTASFRKTLCTDASYYLFNEVWTKAARIGCGTAGLQDEGLLMQLTCQPIRDSFRAIINILFLPLSLSDLAENLKRKVNILSSPSVPL